MRITMVCMPGIGHPMDQSVVLHEGSFKPDHKFATDIIDDGNKPVRFVTHIDNPLITDLIDWQVGLDSSSLEATLYQTNGDAFINSRSTRCAVFLNCWPYPVSSQIGHWATTGSFWHTVFQGRI